MTAEQRVGCARTVLSVMIGPTGAPRKKPECWGEMAAQWQRSGASVPLVRRGLCR